tara:strand:- start:12343 stop:12615 length:273 start_codon:yes stop_codon:yes gene_type:complete
LDWGFIYTERLLYLIKWLSQIQLRIQIQEKYFYLLLIDIRWHYGIERIDHLDLVLGFFSPASGEAGKLIFSHFIVCTASGEAAQLRQHSN